MNKAYPKYKSSGVEWLGDVPEHWEIKRLKYCAPLVTTKAGSSGSNPIALENIESWTGRFIETESEFEGEGIRFQKDDVLFGKLRPYLAKVYLADKIGESVGDIFVLRPAKNTASKYLSDALRTDNYIEVIDGSTYGSKMPRASWEFMGCLPFLLPPLPEQQAIAAFLDSKTGRIDALIAKKQRLLELLAEQRTALISRAVTKGLDASVKLKPSGVEWLGDVPEHWGNIALKWASVRYSGGTPDKSIQEYWEDGTIPWLNSGAVNDDYITEPSAYITKEAFQNSSAKWIPKDALVMALAGQGKTKGMVGQLGFRTTCNQSMAAIVPNEKLNSRMLYWWLTKNYINIRNLAGGEARDGLNLDLLGSIPVPLPPLPEQKAIAVFLDRETAKIDALSAKVTTVIERLKEYRTALISSAVTGKIDVREAV